MTKLFISLVPLLFPIASFASGPTVDELYKNFKEARVALSEKGPISNIKYYSREMLEYKLEAAFESSERDHSKINYTKDSLWAGFQGLGIVNSVYSVSKVDFEGLPAISLKVTSGDCDSPSTLVYAFSLEKGMWRFSKKLSDSTDTKWFNSELEPIDTFPSFEPLDRTEVWREILGKLPEKKGCK